ncbi:MAG: O-antigen ligase family protein [Bacillota bacterium]
MELTCVIRSSIIYRALSLVFQSAAKYWDSSYTCKKINSLPAFSTAPAIEGSLILKAVSFLAELALKPLAALGARLRPAVPGSFLLNPGLPPAMAESRVISGITGVRAETALWILIFYPVVDYLMRKVPALEFLSGSWDELLLLFIIAAWTAQMALRGKAAFRNTGLDIPIAIYIGISLFLFFMRSPDTSLALEGLRVYLQYLLWFFVGSNLLINRRQFSALMKGVVAVAALVSAIGVFQYIIGVEMPAHWVDQAEEGIKTRVFSIVVSPNVLGSLLLIFIPVTLGHLLASGDWPRRTAYAAALGIMLACMVFTYSRGAWLALAGSMAILSLMYNPRLIVLMGACSLAATQLITGIGARLSYMFSPAYVASSQKGGRLALWQKGLDKFLQNPLFGSGFGTYGGAVAARRVPGSVYTDNFYLKTAVESGIIGLLALLWLLASAFRCGYIAYRKLTGGYLKTMAAALIAGLLGVALHNSVENIFEVPMMATYFWFLFGVLLSLPRIEDTE